MQSFQVAELVHFEWLKLTISAFQDFPTKFVFGYVVFQVAQVVCSLGAVEWLGLVSFWEAVFILINLALKVIRVGHNVNFGIVIFGCNSGFIDYVFCEAFISNRAIGLLSTIAWVSVSWGFVQIFFIMAVN